MSWIVVLLAIIEGLTEFIPVSSTGHLVVAASALGFNPVWREPFTVVIQLGAIMAVVVDRRQALLTVAKDMARFKRLFVLLTLGFFPSAVLGLLFHDHVSAMLENPKGVSLAWVIGGVVILVLDRKRAPVEPVASDVSTDDRVLAVTPKQALLVGLAQCCALWPGMSRSGSTIIGGLAIGLDRPTATLLSFYLAIPTMFAASGYELLKFRDQLEGAGPSFAVGMLISFVVAWGTIRWLLRYVQSHTFIPFAVYRIVAGLLILALPAAWFSS